MAALGFDLSWVVLPVEKLHALSQFGPASSRACGGRLKACPGLEEGEGGISAVASLAMGVGGGSGTRIRGLDRGGCSGWGGGGIAVRDVLGFVSAPRALNLLRRPSGEG